MLKTLLWVLVLTAVMRKPQQTRYGMSAHTDINQDENKYLVHRATMCRLIISIEYNNHNIAKTTAISKFELIENYIR